MALVEIEGACARPCEAEAEAEVEQRFSGSSSLPAVSGAGAQHNVSSMLSQRG